MSDTDLLYGLWLDKDTRDERWARFTHEIYHTPYLRVAAAMSVEIIKVYDDIKSAEVAIIGLDGKPQFLDNLLEAE